MADLLQDASDWLVGKLHQHASREVTYVRGSQSVAVAATIGRTVFETANEYGLIDRYESRDFLILAADLMLGGDPIEPQPGDAIRELQNGKTYTYQAMAPGSEPVWRYSDPYRKLLRVHTKLIGSS